MPNKYPKLLNARRTEYKTWKPIYCRAVDDYVFFNEQGFTHLLRKINGRRRKPKEIMYKVGLLPLVRPAIYASTRVEKHKLRISPIRSQYRKRVKETDYWSIEAIVGKQNVKIRIILRRTAQNIHFWSVMKID